MKGKVAIVTGSARGIGREIAISLAKKGANIVMVDMVNDMYDVVKEVEALNSKVLPVRTDVSKSQEVEVMMAETLKTFGTIDILINNAGIDMKGRMPMITEQNWDKMLDVNLKSVFLCSRAVLPTMMKKRYGRIINISSICGLTGWGNVHYASSKAGILGFTRTLAVEVGSYGITVNAVCPGWIEGTQLIPITPAYLEHKELFRESVPLRRIGNTKDVANLVLFLASDAASYITGQAIAVDGGVSVWKL